MIIKRPASERGHFDPTTRPSRARRAIRDLVSRSGLTVSGALAGLVVALAVAVGDAQPRAEVAEATAAVMRQLEAFRGDDFDAAYAFASANVKQIFDRPSFETMVRNGYPEIARSVSAVVMEGHLGPGGQVYLRLTIQGANGRSVDAVYELVREGTDWRINGVVARPTTPTI